MNELLPSSEEDEEDEDDEVALLPEVLNLYNNNRW